MLPTSSFPLLSSNFYLAYLHDHTFILFGCGILVFNWADTSFGLLHQMSGLISKMDFCLVCVQIGSLLLAYVYLISLVVTSDPNLIITCYSSYMFSILWMYMELYAIFFILLYLLVNYNLLVA